jgi:WD40 repeat protein
MPQEPITPDNVDQIRELAIWGKGRIEQLAYSPNGKILAVGTTAGVWLYDAETLDELQFINTGNFVGSLAFTDDSQRLVIDIGASTISTWDVATGVLLNRIRVREGYQGNVNASPGQSALAVGGRLLAAATDDITVGLWDVSSGRHLQTIVSEENNFHPIKNLAISSDQTLLATGAGDETIRLWDIRAGTLLHTLTGFDRGSFSMMFSPDGEILAVTGNEGKIWLWDTQLGTVVRILEVSPSSFPSALAFSSDGALLAVVASEPAPEPDAPRIPLVQIWQVVDGAPIRTLKIDVGGTGLTFSPDNQLLIAGTPEGVVRRWDAQTGTFVDELTGFEGDITGLTTYTPPFPAFLPDSKHLYISNPLSFEVELWELSSGHLEQTLSGPTSNITNLVISDDGSTLAASELWDRSVWLWEADTGQSIGAYEVYIDTGYRKLLAISFDGQLIASGDERDGAGVNNVQPGETMYIVPDITEGVGSLKFSPDGKTLAVISGADDLTLIEARSGALQHKLQTALTPQSLAFAPTGDIVAIGTYEGAIELWNVATGEAEDTLTGETRLIRNLAFSPDGLLLAAGVRDTRLYIGSLTPTIRLWNVETRSFLSLPIDYAATVEYLLFSPDGALLVTSSLDGTVRLWGIPPE